MFHLSLGDQLLDRTGDILDRHAGIDAVLIVEVDGLDPQSSERALGDLANVLGAAVEDLLPVGPANLEPEFGGNHHLTTQGLERFAKELLVLETVYLRRVEERDATLGSSPNERGRLPAIGGGTIPVTQSHGTIADRRDFQATCSKFSLLHCSSAADTFWSSNTSPSLLTEQPGERQRCQLPRALLAHVDLCHHEGVGHLVAANDGVETNSAQHDRGRVDEPPRRREDLCVFVVHPATPDDLHLLTLAPAPAH